MIALAFCTVVVAVLSWVTLWPREAWPFSSYPMFARYRPGKVVCFYCPRFVFADGSVRPFPRSSGRLPDHFHHEFAAVWSGTADDSPRANRVVARYRALAIAVNPAYEGARTVEVQACLVQLGASGAGVVERTVLGYKPSGQGSSRG